MLYLDEAIMRISTKSPQAIRDDVARGYETISPTGPEPRWRVDLFS
jgi:hypothetical protein